MTTLALAAGLGWTAGMRSMAAPAVLSAALATQPLPPPRQPAHALASGPAPALLALAAAGEVVFDKTPGAPDRTAPPVLAGRLASGAFVGAAVASARREAVGPAVWAGMAGAAVSTFVMLAVRREATRHLGALPAALVEDAAALALGTALARQVFR